MFSFSLTFSSLLVKLINNLPNSFGKHSKAYSIPSNLFNCVNSSKDKPVTLALVDSLDISKAFNLLSKSLTFSFILINLCNILFNNTEIYIIMNYNPELI